MQSRILSVLLIGCGIMLFPGAGNAQPPPGTNRPLSVDANGNRLPTSITYENFGGSTAGSAGFGIRNNGGRMEFKNSGGSWADIGIGLTGKTLWVDSVNGSDSTGTRGRSDLPYLTLAAAKTAASSGDTIEVLPGTYTPSANLAKNGVNWYLEAGATISATGNFDLFTDAGGATSYTIAGRGRILLSGHGSCFIISNASSVVHVWASEVTQSTVADPLGSAECGFYQTAGEFHIKADKISGMVAGAYWDNGVCFTEADVISSPWTSGNAIYNQAAAANSNAHFKANEMSAAQPISVGGDPTAAVWITAHRIVGQGQVILRDGVKLYVTAQKIQAASATAAMVTSQGGGFLYIDTQKVEALAISGAATLFDLIEGDSYIAVHQLICSSGVVDAVNVTDGNHFFRSDRIDVLGNGIKLNANATGTVALVGCHITSGAAKKDLIQGGGDGVLEVRACFYDTSKTTGTITTGDPILATALQPSAIGSTVQAWDVDLDSWAAITRGAGFDTFVATPSGANLASVLTSALPASKGGTGLTSLGTGVAAALGVNVGSAGAFVTFNGALGTPSSGSAANLTGFPTLNQNTTGSAAKVVGTTTNDNATAGNVGEYVESIIPVGSPVTLTTATGANITSISLTAGDWDVFGNVSIAGSTATYTQGVGGITITSATVPTDGSEVYSGAQFTLLTVTDGLTVPLKRISIASTTTVYLVAKATFSAGSMTAYGKLAARRVR